MARYRKPTAPEILQNRMKALEWGEQTKQTIAPTMHLVETEHFLIFSAWNAVHDRSVANLCEEMYEKLRRQFNLQPSEAVWIGKCPVYLFWEPQHFQRFTSEVDHVSSRNASAARSDGYQATRGRFLYIVINGVREFGATEAEATIRFHEVLVHEGTHAFLSRFVSSRRLPLWVEEGLADFMAATLVPRSSASQKHLQGARYAQRRPQVAARLFDKTDLTSTDYGIAQSLVRYLIAINSNAFARFIEQMKQGEDDETALLKAYGLSREEYLRRWMEASRR